MTPASARRRCVALFVAGGAFALSAGCGGDEAQRARPAPAPNAGGAGGMGNAAPPPPADSTASNSPRRRRTEPRPKQLRALPEGAARYVIVPFEPNADGSMPERPNFTLTGARRDAADVSRVTVQAAPDDDSSRFAIASTPEPPGGESAFEAPPGFEVIRSSGAAPNGLPRRMRSTVDGMPVCLVSAGLVHLGAGDAPERAFVGAFYMDRHEVTVGQFRRFLEESGEPLPPPTNADQGDDLPAVGISWRSAFLYAKWVGRALPTEAEWVRAVRGDQQFDYPWGNAQPIFGRERGFNEIEPVMSYGVDRSPFGVYDLAGNAGEWTLQTFAENLLRGERPDSSGIYRNPDRGSGVRGAKAVRGLGDGWAVDRRVSRDAQNELDRVGFRCLWRLTDDGTPKGDPLPALGGGAGT